MMATPEQRAIRHLAMLHREVHRALDLPVYTLEEHGHAMRALEAALPPQHDLPADAARVLREHQWALYDGVALAPLPKDEDEAAVDEDDLVDDDDDDLEDCPECGAGFDQAHEWDCSLRDDEDEEDDDP